MARLRSSLFNLSFYGLTLMLACAAMVASPLFGAGAVRWLFRRWCGGTVWLVQHVLGGKVELRGMEHVRDKPALVVSKHQSELDIVLMGMVFPDYGAIAMRELDRYPLVGRIVSQLGYIKVSVEDRTQNQLPEVLEGARRVHEEGRPILIYPEGTLMEPGRKLRYRGGVWHIYNELGVPATPVALSLGLVWPRRDWRKYPGSAAMEFLEPIPPGMDKKAFMRVLEERIETATNRLIREHAPTDRLAKMRFDYEKGVNIWTPRDAANTAADAAE